MDSVLFMDDQNETPALESLSTTKPGVKTSEFWLTVGFTALASFGPIAQTITAPWAMAINAVVVGLYTISRGKAKSLGVTIPLIALGFICMGLTSCAQPFDINLSSLKNGFSVSANDKDGIKLNADLDKISNQAITNAK